MQFYYLFTSGNRPHVDTKKIMQFSSFNENHVRSSLLDLLALLGVRGALRGPGGNQVDGLLPASSFWK